MKLTQRSFKPEDVININKLYKTVSRTERNIPEFEWEWINTWNGQGSSWLVFDEEREPNDQLIMQYSLIPTPFSFWGKSYLAGKTENCMSHPDYRGKRLYFPHEKKYFEEAKKRFQIFFTTAGAGSAPMRAGAAVRKKLGYVALDSWSHFVFCLTPKYLKNRVNLGEKREGKYFSYPKKAALTIASYIFSLYFRFRLPSKPSAKIRICKRNEAPLDEIESFWSRNKLFYMITVDRRKDYLAWRINHNPYIEYQYLLYYQENCLAGYAIFAISKKNVCEIEDILVDKKDCVIFDTVISSLVWHAKKMGANAVLCTTLTGNKILRSAFTRNKFIDEIKLRKIIKGNTNEKAFHVYVSPEVEKEHDPFDPQNWYVTDLVKEGRTR